MPPGLTRNAANTSNTQNSKNKPLGRQTPVQPSLAMPGAAGKGSGAGLPPAAVNRAQAALGGVPTEERAVMATLLDDAVVGSHHPRATQDRNRLHPAHARHPVAHHDLERHLLVQRRIRVDQLRIVV